MKLMPSGLCTEAGIVASFMRAIHPTMSDHPEQTSKQELPGLPMPAPSASYSLSPPRAPTRTPLDKDDRPQRNGRNFLQQSVLSQHDLATRTSRPFCSSRHPATVV